jgi:tRNA 2-thiouridine synthesizing protein E
MAQKTVAGKSIEVNGEGYMTNPAEWNRDIAIELAKEIGITLTDKHWLVLDYLRKNYEMGVALSLRKVGNSGIVDIKGLYDLFPGGPLKKSALIAGIPKPASCV